MALEFNADMVKEEILSDEDADVRHEQPLDVSFDGCELLEFEQGLMLEKMEDDTLFVVASGLGMERLFLHHLMLMSSRKVLCLVINTSEYDDTFFLAKLNSLPTEKFTPPRIITANVLPAERETMYLQGGVQFITSRILMVDFLTKRVPAQHVAAIYVYNAHQLLNTFQESFILRLYREQNKKGHVKAFTDAAPLISSLGQLQRLVDRLFVRNVRLVPRFDASVSATLQASPAISSQLDIELSANARRCLTLLTELMAVCVRDLKQTVQKPKSQEDETETTNAFNLDLFIMSEVERRLRHQKTHLTDRQQRLLSDVDLLRLLLRTAVHLDACSLLARIDSFRRNKEGLENSSGWLLTPTGNRLTILAQQLAAESSNKPEFTGLRSFSYLRFSEPPKWTILANLLKEIRDVELERDTVPPTGPAVMIIVADDRVQIQLIDLIKRGRARLKYDLKKMIRSTVTPQPDEAPLWNVELVFGVNAREDGEGGVSRKQLLCDVKKNQKQTEKLSKKRRKVAESLIGLNQAAIEQYGVVHYRKKQRPNEASAAPNEPGPSNTSTASATQPTKLGDYDNFSVHVVPIRSTGGDKYSTLRALESIKPIAVIMYNSDLTTLRQIEMYHAVNYQYVMYFYLMQYLCTVEEEQYLSKLHREDTAFTDLQSEIESLMVRREYDTIREEAPRFRFTTLNAAAFDDRAEAPPKIVVDMREFNSELPTILYKKGYDVVGDYVLSPGITVERKALDDLLQSLQSGRVFKQAEQMIRYYAAAYLLIEASGKPRFLNGGPFRGELTKFCREIRLQLCTLVRSFPSLKLLWSLSPENSADYFSNLKLDALDPDVERAVELRGDDANEAAEVAKTKSGPARLQPNAVLLRHLSEHLPNFSTSTARRLMLTGPCNSMAELLTASKDDLSQCIPESAERLISLFTFDFRA